ncbi:MAG TPA: (Fe-S)-binding protein [Alicyclobacillus sp.]|nr:(Fe-S)-binding protein [Alicyclobacillus sp.]
MNNEPEHDRTVERDAHGLQTQVVESFRDAAFGCFSSRHKFCREVCPVYQVTGNEQHTSYGFHASTIAMSMGEATLDDVAKDFRHCLQCGACENRCPNTLFTGDFYRNRTRTLDLVKEVRAALVEAGIEDPAWHEWNARTRLLRNEPVLGIDRPLPPASAWADDLHIPIGGETIMFCDCEGAHKRTSVPRSAARLLQSAGVGFGLMYEQWCCGGPALEMGYVDLAKEHAIHNVEDWKRAGARRIITMDPHDLIHFTEDYPRLLGEDVMSQFEIVSIVELLDELIQAGKIKLTHAVNLRVTYHDPCRLNKRRGIWQAPRRILNAIPGLTFVDVDHITQWAYCSGGGGGVPLAAPDVSREISTRRVRSAENLGVEALVSACVWAERPLEERRQDGTTHLKIYDITEIVAMAAGMWD